MCICLEGAGHLLHTPGTDSKTGEVLVVRPFFYLDANVGHSNFLQQSSNLQQNNDNLRDAHSFLSLTVTHKLAP